MNFVFSLNKSFAYGLNTLLYITGLKSQRPIYPEIH